VDTEADYHRAEELFRVLSKGIPGEQHRRGAAVIEACRRMAEGLPVLSGLSPRGECFT
jgi:hypothetical protein